MKKLGKLKLNEGKMLSSEELLGFRGGSGTNATCEGCHAAVHWDCQGYNSTTIWYLDCLQEGHAGCDALAC
jgi:hypothetical protein